MILFDLRHLKSFCNNKKINRYTFRQYHRLDAPHYQKNRFFRPQYKLNSYHHLPEVNG